ncbi:MAG: hypothetical protein E7I16_05160 [Veillonella sp.]|nr:hypothetical protein [Veillonella sp.]
MKYIVVLVVALCMSVMPVLGKQVDRTAQPIQGTRVKQVHSESKTVLSDDLDTFHVNSSHTPDHVIGHGHDWCSFRNARIEGETVDAENCRVIALSEKLEALVWCGNIAATRSL